MTIVNKIHKYKQPNRNWYQRAVKNITRIVIHHDAIPNNGKLSDEECLKNIYNTHTSTNPKRYRNWPGIGYTFWISKKGAIYQLNNFTDLTWHDGVNDDSIGITLNGYFHPDYNEKPTKEQLAALKWLLGDFVQNILNSQQDMLIFADIENEQKQLVQVIIYSLMWLSTETKKVR